MYIVVDDSNKNLIEKIQMKVQNFEKYRNCGIVIEESLFLLNKTFDLIVQINFI